MGQRGIALITVLTLFATQVACSSEAGKKQQEEHLAKKQQTDIEAFLCRMTGFSSTHNQQAFEKGFTILYGFDNKDGRPYTATTQHQDSPYTTELKPRQANTAIQRFQISQHKQLETVIEKRDFEVKHVLEFNRTTNTLIHASRISPERHSTASFKCSALNHPFKVRGGNINETVDATGFSRHLEQNHNWGVGKNSKVTHLGNCRDRFYIHPQYQERSLRCTDGFVQITSPMGVKVCEVEEALSRTTTTTNGTQRQQAVKSVKASLGECRWKS